MKARVKATGEFIEVVPSIHSKDSYDGNDGYTYTEESLIMLENEPDYWEKLKHQYAGMAMQGILSNCGDIYQIKESMVAFLSKTFADELINQLKEEYNEMDTNTEK